MQNNHPDDIIHFEEFTRKGTSVLICLFGFSGCGKTLSAINIATGLGGKTFFLDTETGRGRVYAEDAKGFTYGELTPPFTPERYVQALRQIQRGGFDNLIIDSGSHEWDGLGGMLEIADGNKVAGLGKWSVKSRHKTFMGTLMASRMNVIMCLRAKDKYVQSGRGKDAEIYTDGFVPIQERNFKYDMMIQLPMPEDGQGRYLMDRAKGFKCPRDLLPAFEEGKQINFDVGVKIAEWIKTGQPVDEVLRNLKFEAQEFADDGVASFRAFYASLTKDHQQKLQPFLNNFGNAAKAIDRERAAQAAAANAVIAEGGSDITSLIGAGVASQPAASKSPAMVVRDPNDADWWAIVDELGPTIKKARSVHDLTIVVSDYDRQFRIIAMAAPQVVKDYLNNVIEETKKGFAARAA